MKFELTDAQKDHIQYELERNIVRRWIDNRENIRFEIGDVLIKRTKQYSPEGEPEKWNIEHVGSNKKMHQRYVYVFEDEHGIGFIKRLNVSTGELGQDLWCMTEFDHSYQQFMVDPEFAESTLLGGEFDLKKIHEGTLAARKVIIKMNRKIGVRPKTLKDFNDLVSKMKVGDKFWITHDYTGRYMRECTLSAITKVTVQPLINTDWSWQHFHKKFAGLINDTDTYRLDFMCGYAETGRYFPDMVRDIFFLTQKPALEDKTS